MGLVRLHVAILHPESLPVLQAKKGGYLVSATLFTEQRPEPSVLRLLRLEGWEWTTEQLSSDALLQHPAKHYLVLDGSEPDNWTLAQLIKTQAFKPEEGIPEPETPPEEPEPSEAVKKPRVHVTIPTYQRASWLLLLLQDLVREKRGYELSVHVYDDASPDDYSEVKALLYRHGWRYTRFRQNHGKQRFWELNNLIFRDNRHVQAKFFIRLQDDVRLCKGFFAQAIALWESIPDPRKISLNLLKDDSRANKPCWTGVLPTPQGQVDHTAWVDGWYLVERRFYEVLKWMVKPISASRWRRNRALSSGVGAQISQRLHRYRWGMYRVQRSLISHGDAPSMMNPEARAQNALRPVGFQGGESCRVTASLASIPERKGPLRRVVAALLSQVDRLNVYLNNYSSVPTFLQGHPKIFVARSQEHGDRGDAGKFFWADQVREFHLTCDDDLAYPADYVARILQALGEHDRKAVVGFHGARIRLPFVSYYQSRQVFHFAQLLTQDEYVHVLGTGTVGYHASTLRVTPSDFTAPNMADIWLALLGQKQRVPFLCLGHRQGWLRPIEETNEGSIFTSSRYSLGGSRDTADHQSQVVRQQMPWQLYRIRQQSERKAAFFTATTARPHLLSGCLESLVNQIPPMGWSVDVLVAGTPTDPGRRTAEQLGVQYVECRQAPPGAKLNALLAQTDAEVLLLADDDDIQSPQRAQAALRSYEDGHLWSSSSMIRYLDLSSGRVARWTGHAPLVGTCLTIQTDLARKAGGWPTVPRGKDGLFRSRVLRANKEAPFQDLGPQLGLETICVQHARNIWRKRPFPPVGRIVTRGRFSVLGEGHYREIQLPTVTNNILTKLIPAPARRMVTS